MKSILVTGGGGFLGQAIVKLLLERGHKAVIFNRSAHPELAKLGVRCIQGDIRQRDEVIAAAKDCDAIIHTAAKAGVWGARSEYQAINVEGTKHVLAACEQHHIKHLVYTSSPSVVFDGSDQSGVDESIPYPSHYLAAYPETKATAERLVLNANNENLRTVALRPHLIWGPGDPHLAPRMIDRARKGRLRLIGEGRQVVDTVFVDNAAMAHICALEQLLTSKRPVIAGQAYFVTNQEPWPIQQVVRGILEAAGISMKIPTAPYWLGYFAGAVLEGIYRALSLRHEPPLTRFVVKQLATDHWYDPGRAQSELGYLPSISMQEGMSRLREYYQSLDRESLAKAGDAKDPVPAVFRS